MATIGTADFYRNPFLPSGAFALGLLLFLLPFFDIKCNNVSIVQLSGMDMAFGSKPELSHDMKKAQRGFADQDMGDVAINNRSDSREGKLFITALLALALGVAGLAVSFINRGRKQRTAMMIGLLGALALIGAWIQIGSYVKENAKPKEGPETLDQPFSIMMTVSASPTFWFILCLLSYLAAAYLSYRQSLAAAEKEAPPQTAPQLNIQNPGDQSEFPSAPEGERDLG